MLRVVVDTVSLLSTYVPDSVNYTPHNKATIHWYINEKSEFSSESRFRLFIGSRL